MGYRARDGVGRAAEALPPPSSSLGVCGVAMEVAERGEAGREWRWMTGVATSWCGCDLYHAHHGKTNVWGKAASDRVEGMIMR